MDDLWQLWFEARISGSYYETVNTSESLNVFIEYRVIEWIEWSWCEDMSVLLKKGSERKKTRTVISGGKRPNPSDLGS